NQERLFRIVPTQEILYPANKCGGRITHFGLADNAGKLNILADLSRIEIESASDDAAGDIRHNCRNFLQETVVSRQPAKAALRDDAGMNGVRVHIEKILSIKNSRFI